MRSDTDQLKMDYQVCSVVLCKPYDLRQAGRMPQLCSITVHRAVSYMSVHGMLRPVQSFIYSAHTKWPSVLLWLSDRLDLYLTVELIYYTTTASYLSISLSHYSGWTISWWLTYTISSCHFQIAIATVPLQQWHRLVAWQNWRYTYGPDHH